MDELDNIIESELNNVMELAGIDTESYQQLVGKIKTLPPNKRVKAVKKLISDMPITIQRGSRYEMEMRFGQLPKDIREGLLKKRLQLVDTRLYVVKEITSKSSVDMMMGTDQKAPGLGNFAQQKLEKDSWFLLAGVKLLYAESATKEAANFGLIPAIVRNGDIEMEAGGKKLIGLNDGEIFNTFNRYDVEVGSYKLDSAKVIEPQVEIKMPLKFSAAASSTVCWLRLTMIGTMVVPF